MLNIDEDLIGFTPYGEYICRNIEGTDCIFYHSGATKTRSSGACQYAIDKWNPNYLFVLGTCGGVSELLKPLDIVIADNTAQYDCITGMGEECNTFFEMFIQDIDNAWINFNQLPFTVYEGFVATADQDLGNKQIDMLRSENVLCADWESGAISHICKLNNIKCCVIRGITDIPRKDDINSDINQGEDYRTNTPLVMKKLINVLLPELLKQLNEVES